MALQRLTLGLGAALTTFGVVAVVVIQAIRVDPVAGILGVGLGALWALGVFAAVFLTIENASPTIRRDVTAIAVFGYVAAGVLFLSYANVAGLRSAISPSVVVGAGVVAGIVAWVALWRRNHREAPAS